VGKQKVHNALVWLIQQQQEIEAVRNQLSENGPMQWPYVENEPLNEYQISHLATMAFRFTDLLQIY
jgi:hypothetical protein